MQQADIKAGIIDCGVDKNIGCKKVQEDFNVAKTITTPTTPLSLEEGSKRLWLAQQMISQEINKNSNEMPCETSGSTGSTVVVELKEDKSIEIKCAIIGDSSAFILIFDPKTNNTDVYRINSRTHNAKDRKNILDNNITEEKRVWNAGSAFIKDRLEGNLALTLEYQVFNGKYFLYQYY